MSQMLRKGANKGLPNYTAKLCQGRHITVSPINSPCSRLQTYSLCSCIPINDGGTKDRMQIGVTSRAEAGRKQRTHVDMGHGAFKEEKSG